MFGQALELALSVTHIILPLLEVDGQGMAHRVKCLQSSLLDLLPHAHVGLQLVESFRHDREVAVFKEKRDDALLHV